MPRVSLYLNVSHAVNHSLTFEARIFPTFFLPSIADKQVLTAGQIDFTSVSFHSRNGNASFSPGDLDSLSFSDSTSFSLSLSPDGMALVFLLHEQREEEKEEKR